MSYDYTTLKKSLVPAANMLRFHSLQWRNSRDAGEYRRCRLPSPEPSRTEVRAIPGRGRPERQAIRETAIRTVITHRRRSLSFTEKLFDNQQKK
mgnify:CR=1 FL=1